MYVTHGTVVCAGRPLRWIRLCTVGAYEKWPATIASGFDLSAVQSTMCVTLHGRFAGTPPLLT